MSGKYRFKLESRIRNHPLPSRIIFGQEATETRTDVLLKFLGFVLFQRERLQISPRLHDDNIPLIPGLVQLDYQLKPALWIECGDCPVTRLDKLAVKVPEAALWVLQASHEDAAELIRRMAKARLRKDRYSILSFRAELIEELLEHLGERNELCLFALDWEESGVQFEMAGLWFDETFQVTRF